MQNLLSSVRSVEQEYHQQETERWEEYLIQHRIWSWKHTRPLWKQPMHNKNIFPVISIFHSSFCAPALFTFFWWFPLVLPPPPISYPLKNTEIGSRTGKDIIYLRLLFKSYKIPGFKLYTEKQSNTSTGNHPSLWENRPVQTACSTYLTSKGCESKSNAEIACCVALERVFTSIQRNLLYFSFGIDR